jgi:hypothetical protein
MSLAGYGVFAMETFDFSDYRVSEVITGYGRLIHKQRQKNSFRKVWFRHGIWFYIYISQTLSGSSHFTDSILIKNASLETINDLILECKDGKRSGIHGIAVL